jgi:hypothetical protein
MNKLILKKNLILFKYLTYQELYIIYFHFLFRVNLFLKTLSLYKKTYINKINKEKLNTINSFKKWLLKIKKALKKNYFYF